MGNKTKKDTTAAPPPGPLPQSSKPIIPISTPIPPFEEKDKIPPHPASPAASAEESRSAFQKKKKV